MARTERTARRTQEKHLMSKKKEHSKTALENVTGQYLREMLNIGCLQERKVKCLAYLEQNAKEQETLEHTIKRKQYPDKATHFKR